MTEREPWRDTLRTSVAVSRDGTRIAYEALGRGQRALLLANGPGGRHYSWTPLLDALWERYRLVTWDYRGLFGSGTPATARQLALTHHVDDALAVCAAEGIERCVVVGWSMGVQVGLDLAATRPALVGGLILVNGTYGHALSSGFQPLFPVPLLPKRIHAAIDFMRRTPGSAGVLARVVRAIEAPTLALLALTAGRRAVALAPLLRRYFDDVLGDDFENFLRLFQELDAHSVYHLLPEIRAPALVVSGLLDMLTPARQSREIAARLPDAEHLALARASHFALLERPELVVPAVQRFLDARAAW